jgi:hypothetical protein
MDSQTQSLWTALDQMLRHHNGQPAPHAPERCEFARMAVAALEAEAFKELGSAGLATIRPDRLDLRGALERLASTPQSRHRQSDRAFLPDLDFIDGPDWDLDERAYAAFVLRVMGL